MIARLRAACYVAVLTALALATLAAPAGAQQLIDASEQGGEAFLAFAITVFLFTGTLFYMDRIRRKRQEQ